jgi:DNA polymerase family B
MLPLCFFSCLLQETVRRDQCALTQKVLRNCLISLFNSGIDTVKAYLFRQWQRILSRKVPISDFIITGRVRSRYRGGKIGPVQAALHARLKETDPGRVMRHGERLAYVIVATPGGRNAKLRDGVKTPMELLEQWDAFVVNSAYYITKHVNPALQRCLGLAPNNINVTSWYESCPKPLRRSHFWPVTLRAGSATVSSFFGSSICALCGQKGKTQDGSRIAICDGCKKDRAQSLITSMERLNLTQRQAHAAAQQCAKCNLCFEDASTFAAIRPVINNKSNKKSAKGGAAGYWGAGESAGVVTPLANCSCIDCPTTFERHRLREIELEATAVCRALEG